MIRFTFCYKNNFQFLFEISDAGYEPINGKYFLDSYDEQGLPIFKNQNSCCIKINVVSWNGRFYYYPHVYNASGKLIYSKEGPLIMNNFETSALINEMILDQNYCVNDSSFLPTPTLHYIDQYIPYNGETIVLYDCSVEEINGTYRRLKGFVDPGPLYVYKNIKNNDAELMYHDGSYYMMASYDDHSFTSKAGDYYPGSYPHFIADDETTETPPKFYIDPYAFLLSGSQIDGIDRTLQHG